MSVDVIIHLLDEQGYEQSVLPAYKSFQPKSDQCSASRAWSRQALRACANRGGHSALHKHAELGETMLEKRSTGPTSVGNFCRQGVPIVHTPARPANV